MMSNSDLYHSDPHSQLEELTMLQRVDQELSRTLHLDSVMELTLDWAMRRTGAIAGMLAILNADNTGLIPYVTLGYGRLPYNADHPIPVNFGVVGYAVRTHESHYVSDVDVESIYQPLMATSRSAIAVPMVMRGEVIGVLTLEGNREDIFSVTDRSFLERLANRAAIALDNARLYQEAERRADDMSTLYAASRMISSSIERSEVLKRIAEALSTVLEGTTVVIAERQQQDVQQYQVKVCYEPTGVALRSLFSPDSIIFLERYPELIQAQQGNRLWVIDAQQANVSPVLREWFGEITWNWALFIPLMAQNNVLGIVFVVETRANRSLHPSKLMMVESLRGQVELSLQQALLYEAVRQLETLKSEMIRMASHDLRSPLNAAMGFFDLMMRQLHPYLVPPLDSYEHGLHESLQHMRAIIDDLLTLERIESEGLDIQTVFDLVDLVNEAYDLQMFQSLEFQHHMTLDIQDQVKGLYITGNRAHLKQALNNLIGNAIKYTPTGGAIQVRVFRDETKVHIEVEDNGYGISPENMQHLFQRFFRAREPETNHINGSGLGLSLVKSVIDRHRGEVWAHSQKGRGSVFGLWLPLPTVST